MSIPGPSREPGFFERYYICRCLTGAANEGFNLSVQLNHPISDALLSNALRTVILQYPLFSTIISRKNGSTGNIESRSSENFDEQDKAADGANFVLHQAEQILYSDVVARSTIKAFDSDQLKVLNYPIIPVATGKVTWRLEIITETETGNEYLCFICNHILLDGRSAVYFFNELVHAIAEADGPLSQLGVLFDLDSDAAKSIPESSATCVDIFDPPTMFTVKTLVWHFFIPKFVQSYYTSWFSKSSPNLVDHPVLRMVPFNGHNEQTFRLVSFSPGQVKSILSYCKMQGVSMTTFMAAAMYKAVEKSFTPIFGSFSQKCHIIICGRRYYPEHQEKTKFGVFSSTHPTVIGPNHQIADAAKYFSTSLGGELENRHSFFTIGLLKLIKIWDYMKGYINNERDRDTFEISNLGLVDLHSGDWRVVDAIFSQGVSSTHFTLSVITTSGGMRVSIACHKDIEKYSEDSQSILSQCIASFQEFMTDID